MATSSASGETRGNEAASSTFGCAICNEPMRLWVRVPSDCKTGRANDFGDVYYCDACRYGGVRPIPSADRVATFYELDQYYTQGQSHFVASDRNSVLDRIRVHVAWRLDRGTPLEPSRVHQILGGRKSKILDLGCGSGWLLAGLADLGHSMVGVEVDPNAISRDPQGRFTVFAGTAEEIPPEVANQRFDAIILSHVLEHCREPMRVLANVRALLVPGGKLVCEVPNNAARALELSGCAWEMFDVPRHLHFFTRQSLELACRKAGFRIEETAFGHYARQFKNDWIETERKLWQNAVSGATQPWPVPARNSRATAWRLLATTFAAGREAKYDSVSVVAAT